MTRSPIRRALVVLLAGALVAGPVLADKPEWAGGGKDKGSKHKDKDKGDQQGKGGRDERRAESRDPRTGHYFDERDRRVATGYYEHEYSGRKKCPPGLAKKNNGCMPPGQAKKYAVGQPLPAGVVYYPVPQPVLVQLPPAPAGHKYVRIAADILLIAVGSSMVVDAMSDLMH